MRIGLPSNVGRENSPCMEECPSGHASAMRLRTVRSATRFYFQIVPGKGTARKRSVTVATATTAAASSTITEAAATTAAGAFGLGPGFVHVERAPTDL